MENKSLSNLFKFWVIGFVICAIKVPVNIVNVKSIEDVVIVVKKVFYLFMLCFNVGFCSGLANMFGIDLYLYIKKNLKNEWQFRSVHWG